MVDENVRQLVDEAMIRRLLQRYCRAVDRGDEETIEAVSWPDAVDDHGTFTGSPRDFAPYAVERVKDRFATFRDLGASLIEFKGDDVAVGETYVRSTYASESEGGWVLELFFSRFLDRFERRAGEWRIAQRRVVRDFACRVPVEAVGGVRSLLGARDRSDPSWAHFEGESPVPAGT